jgi:hypothetical protein
MYVAHGFLFDGTFYLLGAAAWASAANRIESEPRPEPPGIDPGFAPPDP